MSINNQPFTEIGENTRNYVLRKKQKNRPMNKKSRQNLIMIVTIIAFIILIVVLAIFGYKRLNSTHKKTITSTSGKNKHQENIPTPGNDQEIPPYNNTLDSSLFKNEDISLPNNNLLLVTLLSQKLKTETCFSISSMLDCLYVAYPNLSTIAQDNIQKNFPSINESIKSIEKTSQNYLPYEIFNVLNKLFLLEQVDDNKKYLDIIKDEYKFLVENVFNLNNEGKINNINYDLSVHAEKVT